MKNIVLLGATGSIGQSALNVLRQNSDSFNLLGIAFNNNFDIALDIANEFKPDFIFYSANEVGVLQGIKNIEKDDLYKASESALIHLLGSV